MHHMANNVVLRPRNSAAQNKSYTQNTSAKDAIAKATNHYGDADRRGPFLIGGLRRRTAMRPDLLGGVQQHFKDLLQKRFHERDAADVDRGILQDIFTRAPIFQAYHEVTQDAIEATFKGVKQQFADVHEAVVKHVGLFEATIKRIDADFKEHVHDTFAWAKTEVSHFIEADNRITEKRAKLLKADLEKVDDLDELVEFAKKWAEARKMSSWLSDLDLIDVSTALPMLFADFSSKQGFGALLDSPYVKVRALLIILYVSVMGPRRSGPQITALVDFVMTSIATGAFGTSAEIQFSDGKMTTTLGDPETSPQTPSQYAVSFKTRGSPMTASKRIMKLKAAEAHFWTGEVMPLSSRPDSYALDVSFEAGGEDSGHQVTLPTLYSAGGFTQQAVPVYIRLEVVGDEPNVQSSWITIRETSPTWIRLLVPVIIEGGSGSSPGGPVSPGP
jgi:hypothetical protein